MKEKIYTIPVRDAFSQAGSDCPLCLLKDGLTQKFLSYFLGSSLMEPNIRITTNEKGFCAEHAQALYQQEENKLGLGLMMHTRLKHVMDSVSTALEQAEDPERRSRGRKKKDAAAAMGAAASTLKELGKSCAVCERIDGTMEHYLDVICWMHGHDEEFNRLFKDTHHFCVPHMADLLGAAGRYLKPAAMQAFLEDVKQVAVPAMSTLADDVEWFTLKFDYRNNDKPWGNSKDAVIRAIRTVGGGVAESVVGKKNGRDR